MAKLLLGSVMIVPLLLALRCAALSDPRRGLRRAMIQSYGYLVVWILSVIFVYFKILYL